ncbi:uncharacterized protein LOC128263191 [Drosophila gunungcola]|uniref:uncharacterized protein LOC128263191 n=1 Tax=Drosophila gunungcola TaxID=103775 RepID=UPI0022DF1488|nr:uncharacterized protein LOC128263191 [Drosophila gunungcola]
MDKKKPSLLPYIMDLLSRQPHLFTSKEELIEGIRDVVLEEHITPFGTLQQAVDFSLDVGVSLGILSLTDERVRMPFNYRKGPSKKKLPAGTRISPQEGRRAIKQRMPKARPPKPLAKVVGKRCAKPRKAVDKANTRNKTGKAAQKKPC